MENLFPIIGLVIYFLLTGLLRKRNQERKAPRPARPHRQNVPPSETFDSPSTKRSESVRSREPEQAFDSESEGKQQGYTDFQSIFSNVSERAQESTRDSLLQQILGAFDEAEDLTQAENVIEDDAIEMDTEVIHEEEKPATRPADTQMPSDATIREGQSVFREAFDQPKSEAYAVSLDSYLLDQREASTEERLESIFKNRSILVRGILMSEILGKPRAFSSSEYW
ncbi:MAG: hypothetical protein K9N11_00235 [Lentisphaeria bacterium]|nr:hypothetical protein [Candidatus Neomarinimicrobiota bacterium]MCF7841253.1 hypothetical protein [Lentisphaeria bacterium]